MSNGGTGKHGTQGEIRGCCMDMAERRLDNRHTPWTCWNLEHAIAESQPVDIYYFLQSFGAGSSIDISGFKLQMPFAVQHLATFPDDIYFCPDVVMYSPSGGGLIT